MQHPSWKHAMEQNSNESDNRANRQDKSLESVRQMLRYCGGEQLSDREQKELYNIMRNERERGAFTGMVINQYYQSVYNGYVFPADSIIRSAIQIKLLAKDMSGLKDEYSDNVQQQSINNQSASVTTNEQKDNSVEQRDSTPEQKPNNLNNNLMEGDLEL